MHQFEKNNFSAIPNVNIGDVNQTLPYTQVADKPRLPLKVAVRVEPTSSVYISKQLA